MESCKNCGKLIGARQPAQVIGDAVYCEMCGPVAERKRAAVQQTRAAPDRVIPCAQPGPMPAPMPAVRIYGLSWGETWVVGVVGLCLVTAVVGIPIVIWAWLS